MKKLTSQHYWENYYGETSIDVNQIKKIVSVYTKLWELLIANNHSSPPETILEIGGYPGRYIAYLANKYNLTPTCLDYNSDSSKIKANFRAFDVNNYEIVQENIFNHTPEKQYDIVFSNGLIEHFDNFDDVMDIHCKYLKKGGTLLIMVPNKRWLRKWYGYLVDYKNLKVHNLNSMSNKVFTDFGIRNNLEIIDIDYLGGFPYAIHQKPNYFQSIIYRVTRLLFLKVNPYIQKHPSKYFSAVLYGVYKKK